MVGDEMKVFIRMWNAPDVKLDCKEIIVKDGVTMNIDGEDTTFLVVVASDGIYHPVVDVEAL